MTNYIGILPIAGNATRMNHIPKFLLPAPNNTTLLCHVMSMLLNNNIHTLYAGLSEINHYILQHNNYFHKLVVNTKTMAETVKLLVQHIDAQQSNYNVVLLMPDTYFKVTNELDMVKYHLNTYKIVLVCWKIKDYQVGKVGQCNIINDEVVGIIDKDSNCQYPYFWGIISWSSELNCLIKPEWNTIGELVNAAISMGIKVRAIISHSNYYDCGTHDEYFKMIQNEINNNI